VAIGNAVKRQAMIIGFGDTLAIIGAVLAIAAVALLLARKVEPVQVRIERLRGDA